ncbi:MAG: outer membrane protein transport protein, partial [Gammaproteobacteria bacterium]|nr:outer membrane protein transport protein [Gammaproteobacteria bacterium]
YDTGWVGRYTATKSEVHTLNINPSFAAKATDKLSVGFGFNIQYIEATLANQLDSAAICQDPQGLAGAGGFCNLNNLTLANIGTSTYDSSISLSGDDLNFGWNAGILYQMGDNAKLGVAYRSSIKHQLDGTANFVVDTNLQTVLDAAVPAFNLFEATGVIASVELPESLSVSYARNMGDKLSILADVTWTRWSNFRELTIVFDNPYMGSSTIPENWDNSYRYSFGANYKQNDKMTLRAGIAVDQTPIRSPEDRTPRIPGDDRTWLSFGVGYNMSSDMTIDVGFSHLFVDDTDLNNTDASFGHTVTGKYDADVNILSAQANLKF